jgi:hypothetical protein
MTSESDEKPDEEAWLCNYGDLWVVASHTQRDICLARNKGDEHREVLVPLDTGAARHLIQCLQYAIATIEARPVKDTEEPQ